MKIQHKITAISSFLFGVVFLVTSVIIYMAFYQSSKNIFFQELSRTAKISAMFYLERDELSQKGFQPIQDAFYNLSTDEQVSIFDENGKIAFNTKHQQGDWSGKLNATKEQGSINFRENDTYYHGLYYKDNQGDFVVMVKATNLFIQSQKKKLLIILIISFCMGMFVLILLTSWLSKLAYKPVRNIIRQVNTLNLNKTPLQLSYESSHDELEELFEAFNSLLNEIEATYSQQKNFVDFSSHELKTPLASIINQLEISLQRKRTQEDYIKTNKIVLQDAQQLQAILENLLVLSSLNRTVKTKQNIRIDEVIWSVIEKLSIYYPSELFKVDLNISPENFELLILKGNEALLYMAFYNIIENAVKFSEEKPVNIQLFQRQSQLHINVIDKGIGIEPEDLMKINQPFYRANNALAFKGSGLGMSIALKIFQLHDIQHSIKSIPRKQTQISLTYPNIIKKD